MKVNMEDTADRYQKSFPVSWEQLHRDAKALAWRLADMGPWQSVVAITRGGLVPSAIIARELEIRMIDTVCVSSYEHQSQGGVDIIKGIEGSGEGVLLIDDLVDTAGTLGNAAGALKDFGAKKVVAYCTHAVLSGNAVKNIENSKLDELVVTDTIPLRSEAKTSDRIRQLSVAGMLAESIRRVAEGESLSSMFLD